MSRAGFLVGILLLIAFSRGAACAQTQDSLLYTLPAGGAAFTVDKLQQAYVADSSNAVTKYSPSGQEQFRYYDNSRGRLGYIDATDPFNLLLFYPDLQAIVLLDRTLNERGVLPLFAAGVLQASAAALARDNNIWVYDEAAFRLLKLGPDGAVLADSGNLSALLPDPPRRGAQLMARGNWVYLNAPGQGIYVFDNFTQFHERLPFEEVAHFELSGERLYLYGEKGGIRAYHTRLLREVELQLNTEGAKLCRLQNGRFYRMGQNGAVQAFLLRTAGK